jgi:hypothetical protein
MFFIVSSAGCFSGPDFCLIFAPCGYDDPMGSAFMLRNGKSAMARKADRRSWLDCFANDVRLLAGLNQSGDLTQVGAQVSKSRSRRQMDAWAAFLAGAAKANVVPITSGRRHEP